MEIKNIETMTVYGKTFITTLKEMIRFVNTTPHQIAEEINAKKLNIIGSQIWHYDGCDGNPDNKFNLIIGFPVEIDNFKHNDELIEIRGSKCLCHNHLGDWSKFGESYGALMEYIRKNDLKMTGNSRELYHVVDFENPTNNITEIQFEII